MERRRGQGEMGFLYLFSIKIEIEVEVADLLPVLRADVECLVHCDLLSQKSCIDLSLKLEGLKN
jgi:hypothetical protein